MKQTMNDIHTNCNTFHGLYHPNLDPHVRFALSEKLQRQMLTLPNVDPFLSLKVLVADALYPTELQQNINIYSCYS